jgi:hypothetical protein
MSLESDVGRVTNDVVGAISDSVLSDEQVTRVVAIARSTIESMGYNGVNQYVSLFEKLQHESSSVKKTKLFG